VRVFYDKNDDAIQLIAYDTSGYIDLELNFEYERTGNGEDIDVSGEEDSGNEWYIHHKFQDNLFDARGAIAGTPSGAPEVVVQQNGNIFHFKKIPTSRYDIYMKDPFWLYYNITGIEKRFYDLGYKSTEVMKKHIDGIIDSSRYMYYDHKGVFWRRVFMCGTPWGSILPYDEEVWDYDFRKNTAIVKEVSTLKMSSVVY
jgi:hypothetical protein